MKYHFELFKVEDQNNFILFSTISGKKKN